MESRLFNLMDEKKHRREGFEELFRVVGDQQIIDHLDDCADAFMQEFEISGEVFATSVVRCFCEYTILCRSWFTSCGAAKIVANRAYAAISDDLTVLAEGGHFPKKPKTWLGRHELLERCLKLLSESRDGTLKLEKALRSKLEVAQA